MIKVHIKLGSAEIDIEGDPKGVHDILERHWEPHVSALISGTSGSEVSIDVIQEPNDAAPPAAKRRKRTQSKTFQTPGKSDDSALEEEIANKIKASPSYEHIKKKFIIEKASLVDRAKLVMSFHDSGLTSGNVLRVLEKMGVRTDAPAVSKALSANKGEFLTSGSPTRYKMSGATEASFEKIMETNVGE